MVSSSVWSTRTRSYTVVDLFTTAYKHTTTTRQTSTTRVSYQCASSHSCPLAQHRHLMRRHATVILIVLPNTSSTIMLATNICPTKNIAPRVLVAPRVKRDKVRDEIRQRRAVVTPMCRAAAVVATHHHFLLGNERHVGTRRLESRPDARALFLGVAAFATNVAFIAYAACELRAARALCGAVAALATASAFLVRWAGA